MLDKRKKNLASETLSDLLGEWHVLAEQLGSPAMLCALTSAPLMPVGKRRKGLAGLRAFLQGYYSQILVSHELPAIFRAYTHASRSEARELIASDCELNNKPLLRHFAWASQYVGVSQLQRLRPLRSERLVQRYLHAVEHGQAYGWHTVVYGLVLSLYALPLRQGLLNYGRQTLRGFIMSANHSPELATDDCEALHFELCAALPQAVEALLNGKNGHQDLSSQPADQNGS